MYEFFFRLNFRIRFRTKKNMHQEILDLTPIGKAAMRSHARMVIKVTFPNQKPDFKKMAYKLAASSYRDNIILAQEL
jgi:hypothetical protein